MLVEVTAAARRGTDYKSLLKMLSELDVRLVPLQEVDVQKMNLTSENAGLVYQNRLTKDLY